MDSLYDTEMWVPRNVHMGVGKNLACMHYIILYRQDYHFSEYAFSIVKYLNISWNTLVNFMQLYVCRIQHTLIQTKSQSDHGHIPNSTPNLNSEN